MRLRIPRRSLRKGVIRRQIASLLSIFLVAGTLSFIAAPASAATPIPDTAISMTASNHNQLKAETAALVPTSGSFTYQTWFNRRTGSGQYSMLYSQGTSGNIFYVQVVGTGSTSGIYWNYGGFGGNFGWDIPNNHWAHVSFVYSESADRKANSVKIYVNGSLSYTWNAGANYLANTAAGSNFNKSYIAGYSYADGSQYRFTGQIDETRIYNKALTQAEVQASMHSYGNVSDPNLRAYYDFNDETLSSNIVAAIKNKSTSAAKAPNSDFVELHASGGAPTLDPIAKEATVGNQKYLAFTKSYLSSTGGWQVPAGAASINYLVVGGGGAGGARHGGGGGAGAAFDAVKVPVTEGSKIDVQVGGGGLAATSGDGFNGGDSIISSGTAFRTVARGGGAGGGGGRSGLTGASGGGGGAAWGAGADGTAGLGNKGGSARFYRYDNGGENWQGGGGGGAATAGTAPTGFGDGMRSGSGGTGKTFSWFNTTARNAFPSPVLEGLGQASGTAVYFAGGGSGGRLGWGYSGYPGLGGGGSPYTSGLPNSGSGGGGGNGGTSGYGGTGVVLITYSTVPNVPRDFVARPMTDTQVDLEWAEPVVNGATIDEYQIEYSLTADFATKTVKYFTPIAGSLTQKYSVTGLAGATNYYFRVAAKNPTSTGTFTTGLQAKTWVKIQGTGESAICVDYVSKATGATTELNVAKDSCVVTFTDGSSEWAVPTGVTKIDSLVVGGGGGGGPSAGSGGSGGSVADLKTDLGTSKITKLNVSVGTGGAAATVGNQSTLNGTDGTNSISITSPGGKPGVSGTGTVAAGVAPTVTKAGTSIVLTEKAKVVGGAGGVGTTSSSTGASASGGYSPVSGSVFIGSYAGGGGGGAVASSGSTSTTVGISSIQLDNYPNSGNTSTVVVVDLPKTFPLSYLPVSKGSSRVDVPSTIWSSFSYNGKTPYNILAYNGQPSRVHMEIYFDTPINASSGLSYTQPAANKVIAGGYDLISFTSKLDGSYALLSNAPSTISNFTSVTAGNGISGGGASASHAVGADTTVVGAITAAQPGTVNTGGGGGAGIKTGITANDAGAAGGSGVVKIQYLLVSPPLALTSPTDLTVAVGDSASFSASFTTEVSEIRWQQSVNAGISWTDIAGATTTNASSSTYTISQTVDADNGKRFRAMGKIMKGTAFAETPTGSASLTVTRDAETLPSGAFCDGTSTQNGLTTSAGHGKVFYIDTGQGQEIDAGYVAYTVKSKAARSDLWVELSGFSGGVISLADPSTASMPLGQVAEDGSGTAFFMLKATAATLTAQSHVLRIYNQKPSIGNPAPIYECSFSFSRVEETIKAAANKVDSVVSSSVSSIGSTMTVTVKGDSGTIGQGNDIDGRMFWLIPAARSTWPVNAVRLEKTNLSLYTTQANRDAGTNALKSFDNTLRVNNANGFPADTRQFWTATYTFRIIGPASAPAPIIPIAMISSGTQIKHTDVAGVAGGTLNLSSPTPTIDLKVTKNVSPIALVRDDGTTRFEYEITLTNSGANDLVVDEVIDSPDAKATYVAGSSSYGGDLNTAPKPYSFSSTAIRDPGQIGTTNQVAFSGPLSVPANSFRVIKYSMAIETCKAGGSFSLQNTATARSGTIVIGSGSATQSVVTINANCGEQNVDVFVEDVALPPDVITGTATNLEATTATINGSIDPNGVADRDLRFQYSTSSTLATPILADLAANTTNSNTAYSVSANLTGLLANTTYYYRLEVLVDGVWKLGEILSFRTPIVPTSPLVDTLAVSDIVQATVSQVTFNGTIDANFLDGGVKVKFEYGKSVKVNGEVVCPPATDTPATLLTAFMQTETTTLGTTADSIVTGSGPTPFNFVQGGLTEATDYCVRIIGYHGTGFTSVTNGDWTPFTTLTKLPQQITWKTGTDPLPAKGTTDVVAFANSQLPVTYASVDPSICTVDSSGKVTAVANSGNCVITATQVGNDGYYAAEPATISFLISPPVVTTTTLPTGTYKSPYTTTLEPAGGTGTYTSWGVSGELPPGLTLSSSGVLSGTPTVAGIYTIYVTVTDSNGVVSVLQPLTVTIEKIKVTVTASSHTLTFGDGAPTVTATYDGSQLIAPDTTATLLASPNVAPTCSTNYTRGLDAGSDTAYTSCAGGWATNYTFSYLLGSVTIKPLEVTITALDQVKKVGDPDPTFRYLVSPALPPGQTLADVIKNGTPTGTPTLTRPDPTNPANNTAGEYSITPTAVVAEKVYTRTATDGTVTTETYINYSLKFVTGKLTITDKINPVIQATNQVITFSEDLTGKLDALAKDGTNTVAGSYSYYYLDSDGNQVALDSSSKLPAGSYTIMVKFTPTDGSTYHGPIFGSFTLTVKPFEIVLTALDAAKQNIEFSANLQVNPDPKLHYTVHPRLPAGQTLTDVFSNGVKVNRDKSGTASGSYPKSNTTIKAKEGLNTTFPVVPGGEYSPNYKVTIVPANFIITGKKVPDLTASDATRIVDQPLGDRLNASPTFEGNTVDGELEYSYMDDKNQKVVVTPNTVLPLGVHSLMVKFTPTNSTTYFGPIYSSMFVTVKPFVPEAPADNSGNDDGGGSGNNNAAGGGGNSGGNSSGPSSLVPPVKPKPFTPKYRPDTSGSSAANTPGSNTPNQQGPKAPYVKAPPVAPGFGSLVPRLPAGENTAAGATGAQAEAGIDTKAWFKKLAVMTTDLGDGVKPATPDLAQTSPATLTQASRSLSQIAVEKMGGFFPPGSGVAIEVLGARTGARFVVSDVDQIDSQALLFALRNSIETQKADFFEIENLSLSDAPELPKRWSEKEQQELNNFFAGAGLANPISLADIELDQVKDWVGLKASASSYVPGSVVYLTVTSTPLVFASAVVDKNGTVSIEGSMPVQFLGAGEHRIRLVGTRSLDGVFVDDQGQIQVTDQTMAEIERFDLQTQATIAFVGSNKQGGNHVAMRVIPLLATAPWWTLIVIGLAGLTVIGLRRRGIYFNGKSQAFGPALILVSTVPAVVLGWLSSVTEVLWFGLLLAAVLIGLSLLARPKSRSQKR